MNENYAANKEKFKKTAPDMQSQKMSGRPEVLLIQWDHRTGGKVYELDIGDSKGVWDFMRFLPVKEECRMLLWKLTGSL